jgi:RsiW-degrading membrane proteinase PrsW (M82 family)
MLVTQVQLKMIAIGLLPVFFILSVIMQDSTSKTILLAVVVITALVTMYIGWSMEKREAKNEEDLLAVPPKKS